MLHFLNLILTEGDDKSAGGSSFFANFEVAVMNIAMASINAGAEMYNKSGIYKILNIEIIYLLIMINASSALTFAGIIYERIGVIFFMTIFTYTFLGFFNGLFDKIGSGLGINGAWFQSATAFLICVSFLVFYEIVKPIFMAMIIFLVFNAISSSIGAVPVIVHILVFIGIVIAVKFTFKFLSKGYKFMVIAMFAIYGSLLLLSSTFGLILLPLHFDEYLQKFIDQGSVFGPLVESWNSLIWFLFIVAGIGAQLKLIDHRHESEGETAAKEEETK